MYDHRPPADLCATEAVWDQVDQWLAGWRAAHPDEEREDLEILLSPDYQDPGQAAPYWPAPRPSRRSPEDDRCDLTKAERVLRMAEPFTRKDCYGYE